MTAKASTRTFTYGYCAYGLIRHIEAVVFPFLNQKLDFHTEIDQHKVIFSSVEKIIATVTLYQSDLTKYDPEYLKSLMVALRDPLVRPSSWLRGPLKEAEYLHETI